MPENSKPQIDREKLAKELYPTPASGPLAVSHPDESQPTDKPAGKKLLWGKIALVGALTMAPFALAIYAMDKMDTSAVFGLTVLGVIPAAAFVVLLVAFGLSTLYLRKLGLQNPVWVAALALLFIAPLLLALSSVLPEGYSLVAWVVSGALGLCLSAYVLERARPIWGWTIVAVLVLLPVLLALMLKVIVKNSDYYVADGTRVSDLEWELLPNSLPTYMTDETNDAKSCAKSGVLRTYYECNYKFTYPGYLSPQSQAIVDKAVASRHLDSADSLAPNVQVIVMRDHKTLNDYKYQDGQCDISGLSVASAAPRNLDGSVSEPEAAEPRKCGKITTPAGKTLYYDSSLFGRAEFEPVPYDFYFEQNGNIIFVKVGTNPPQTDTLGSVYYTDPGYQPAVYSLVDSFR